jgi:intracellular sulfur oxidation DsrE/DsrF family protein
MGGTASAIAATSTRNQAGVVYHLADSDRVTFVLGNIHNHYAGVGDERFQIALVVHGGALRAFRVASASLEVTEQLRELIDINGLRALACSNSLRAQNMSMNDLLPGFRPVESGVVTIAQLQARGYAYIRP